ncbi:hypothetical protein C173_27044, partial [Paenibacillus sp. FSL R7-277]|uniref:hypothetical protein n=1 Tax=Paenibacillus sp. FSL R7-277 TaxID=1227352 RepID=UPI0003E2306E
PVIARLGKRGFATVIKLPLRNESMALKVDQALRELETQWLLFLPRLSILDVSILSDGNVVRDRYRKITTLNLNDRVRQVALSRNDIIQSKYWISELEVHRKDVGFK